MSELQTDDATLTENENVELGTGTTGSDLATDSAAEREEKDPAVVAQEKAQKAINKQHAKYREEERKRIAAEDKAKKLEDKLEAIEGSIVKSFRHRQLKQILHYLMIAISIKYIGLLYRGVLNNCERYNIYIILTSSLYVCYNTVSFHASSIQLS